MRLSICNTEGLTVIHSIFITKLTLMCYNSYCIFTKRDQEKFFRTAEAPDFKVFWD